MTHFKKYWIWYTVAIVVIIAAILAYANWETVKGWFNNNERNGNVSQEKAKIQANDKALLEINRLISSSRNISGNSSKYSVGSCSCNKWPNGHGFCCCNILKDGNTVGDACANF